MAGEIPRKLRLKLAVGALASLVLAGTGTGCKTHSPSPYVSPRITGRVLDKQTHQPIKDVRVRRAGPEPSNRIDDPPKGGQMMERTPTVRTAADGTFVLESERSLVLLRTVGWYAVSVSFSHPAYALWTTNYTLVQATNTTSGEPLVNTGDIMLIPVTKGSSRVGLDPDG
jgi:hypothetical protein